MGRISTFPLMATGFSLMAWRPSTAKTCQIQMQKMASPREYLTSLRQVDDRGTVERAEDATLKQR